ncbi:MAG: hypothetical protein KAR65_08710 [Anaerolineales bacterium]|nr:hypothetical protein [Anaerolineales bacterium]
MAEVRCPMCSTMNQEAAEVCSNCQARLTPLIADLPPSEQHESGGEGSAPPDSDTNGGDDWLANIRADAVMGSGADDHVEETDAVDETSPDWLGRLREADSSLEEGPPSEEIPDWMDDFLAAGDDGAVEEEVPEWLSRVRARREGQTGDQSEAGEGDDWITRLRDDAPDEQPAGLEDLKPSPDDDESIERPAPRALDISPPPDVPEIPLPQDEVVQEHVDPSPEAGDITPPADRIEEDPQPAAQEPLPPEEEMEWFPAPDERELAEAEGLPHVPALLDEETGEAPAIELGDLNLDSIELPDWLGELKSETPPATEEEGEGPDLAPATLPSWLEAMRPVDTFRSEIEIESEEVLPVESAGPLAGLRGVLMAEPVVAMPRSASTAAARLEVTERQYAQGELLQRLVEEEEMEIAPVKAERRRLPLMRWVIAFILLFAVILPFGFSQLGVEGYALPSVVSRDLEPLINLIGSIPTERPALVVFDYTPGYSGELDMVAGALLEHVIMRSLPIVTISTRPTGPPLAEGLLNKIGADYGAVNGESYLHLGYLSGGPTAVQLFSIAPRSVVFTGYHLPDSLSEGSVWESPLLQGVQRLSDFGLVVVITAGTDTARTWVEQTHPWIGDSPLVMVLSAGAEPLVRPYFEASEPQVDGILTGLPAAVSYRQFSGLPLDTGVQWNAFGMGLLAVELILIAGGAYGVGLWLLGLRKR